MQKTHNRQTDEQAALDQSAGMWHDLKDLPDFETERKSWDRFDHSCKKSSGNDHC